MQLFCVALFVHGLITTFFTPVYGQLTLDEIAARYTIQTPTGGVHLPIVRLENKSKRRNFRRAPNGTVTAVGLGDTFDFLYSALVRIGGITTPLLIDTGSSDLWVISDDCQCGTAKSYPLSNFRSAGIGLQLRYGGSSTTTTASGSIGFDSVGLGNISLANQTFGAINKTNSTLVRIGLAGILGLGFPMNSVIAASLYRQRANASTLQVRDTDNHPPFNALSGFRRTFPSISDWFDIPYDSHHVTRQQPISPEAVKAILASWSTFGPFVSRLILQGSLPQPMITVALQRNVMDVGGNLGMLSIGELPPGVNASNLTWAPLRPYGVDVGGLPAPSDSPSETYPIPWEIFIDNVYFDGQQLPRSDLLPQGIELSAVVDTGDSLVRGPSDLVSYIYGQLGPDGTFKCSEPHNLTFEIAGKMFPVDPRDFARQASDDTSEICAPVLAETDAPRVGGYLFSWSLGDPFMKGVLSSFYFGNITYPSRDPPRIGFLSTVPNDAGNRLRSAAMSALRSNTFPDATQDAPSVLPTASVTNSQGVPQANSVPPYRTVSTVTSFNTSTSAITTFSSTTLRSFDESFYRFCPTFSYLSSTAFLSFIFIMNIGL